jgi:predicted membrane protein
MDNQNLTPEQQTYWNQWEQNNKRGKIFGGILVVTAGSLFLARELGADLPHWLFSWKTFLIALGLFIGVKHQFRRMSWIVLMLIGGAFLLEDFYPEMHIKHILFPAFIILFGLMMIFKPRGRNRNRRWERWNNRHGYNNCYGNVNPSSEDYIACTTIFGSEKKNIISKEFKGGDMTVIFGSTELNLTQADFTGTATLEMTHVFAGTKLIIPSNWEVKSEIVSVMGSVEDKRQMQQNTNNDSTKKLILKGTTFCGGIDIKTY